MVNPEVAAHLTFAIALGSFLDPWDVVEMRTMASRWNIPSEYSPCGELFVFLVKKEPMCAMSSGTSSDEEFEEHSVKNLFLEVVGEGW